MQETSAAERAKNAPWRVTLTIRSGSGASAPGWMWGARLEADAQKALAQWLL